MARYNVRCHCTDRRLLTNVDFQRALGAAKRHKLKNWGHHTWVAKGNTAVIVLAPGREVPKYARR